VEAGIAPPLLRMGAPIFDSAFQAIQLAMMFLYAKDT
jgi:hypothetical protein